MAIPELILIGLMMFIPLALIALVVTARRRTAKADPARVAELENRVAELEKQQRQRPQA